MAAPYDTLADQAKAAGLQPLTIDETASLYRDIGTSRQTAWYWRAGKTECPMNARYAAAWAARQRAETDRQWVAEKLPALMSRLASINDVSTLRRVAHILGMDE